MKPKSFGRMNWVVTLGVLVGVVCGVHGAMKSIRADDTGSQPSRVQQAPVAWEVQRGSSLVLPANVRISPLSRPPVAAPATVEQAVRVPTDDELRAQLQAELNRRFPLVLIAWSITHTPSAFVRSSTGDIHLFKGDSLRKHGADAVVTAVGDDHVVLDAAMPGHEPKRFEVMLMLKADAPSKFAWQNTDTEVPPDRIRIRGPKQYDGLGPSWDKGTDNPVQPVDPDKPRAPKLTPEDFKDFDKDEVPRYIKVTEHGLQVAPELPEDSTLYRLGARGGDMLKTINGQAIKSIAAARKFFRDEYDKGVREFVIVYERKGVPATRTIELPAK